MAEQPPNAQGAGDGGAFDEHGNPLPGIVYDSQGNPFHTYVYDEYGGYYDMHLYYHDNEGNIWDPAGQLYATAEDMRRAHEEEAQYYAESAGEPSETQQAPQQYYGQTEQQQQYCEAPQQQQYREAPQQQYYDGSHQQDAYQEQEARTPTQQGYDYSEWGQMSPTYAQEWSSQQATYQQEDLYDENDLAGRMQNVNLRSAPTSPPEDEEEKSKKTARRLEKASLLEKHHDELARLGPNARILREEQLGIRALRKPRALRYFGMTFISTPAGDNWLLPYYFRDRYPGYVRDIEAIEGSHDPKYAQTNPPKSLGQIDPNTVYPKPYIGWEQPPPKEKGKVA
uniref:OCRE domain-containing protein n=1 Tax=Steinernema glaseri TaxID=37863 RepID=A0A1I7ZC40_9BILA